MINEFVPDFTKSLKTEFYQNSTEFVAKSLLGKIIVKKIGHRYLAARIVETEAYLSYHDEASHSYTGITNRNKPMFEDGGILYVYKSYGIHFCTNIVTEGKGVGSAVLIRAAEPIEGVKFMIQNREIENILNLCRGPGNFSKAFGLNLNNNYDSISYKLTFIQISDSLEDNDIVITKRVGISRSADLHLRFYVKNSIFVSKK